MIQVKRAYERPRAEDGKRFLVDRLWPRGVKKNDLRLAGWLRELAPSNALRKWFNHEPEKWTDFQKRYKAELSKHPQAWKTLREAAAEGNVTLVYAAKDPAHNNAVVLKQVIEQPRR